MAKRRKQVPADKVVRALWEAKKDNRTLEDVREELGYDNINSLHSRISKLRDMEIPLPEFEDERGRRGLDVDALKKLAEELSAGK